jgi:hypothetical protein
VEDCLKAARAKDVDQEAFFEELRTARGVPSNWREFEAIRLELVWAESEDGASFQAVEEIVWRYPNGEDEFAPLFRRVVREAEGQWVWGVVPDEEAAGENDPILVHGATQTLEEAKAECEATALRLIDEEKARFARHEREEVEARRGLTRHPDASDEEGTGT